MTGLADLLIALLVIGFVLWLFTQVPSWEPYRRFVLGFLMLLFAIYFIQLLLGGEKPFRLFGR